MTEIQLNLNLFATSANTSYELHLKRKRGIKGLLRKWDTQFMTHKDKLKPPLHCVGLGSINIQGDSYLALKNKGGQGQKFILKNS